LGFRGLLLQQRVALCIGERTGTGPRYGLGSMFTRLYIVNVIYKKARILRHLLDGSPQSIIADLGVEGVGTQLNFAAPEPLFSASQTLGPTRGFINEVISVRTRAIL
jgi:hypothetical protein